MGGPPGMGGGGMSPQVPVKMKERDVWDVLKNLLGKHQHPGNAAPNMVKPSSGHLMK
jgi:hypothetical protein